jgi:hypothetical protein
MIPDGDYQGCHIKEDAWACSSYEGNKKAIQNFGALTI